MNINKTTANVYRGAAFLILVLGTRTIARTIDFIPDFFESILTILTFGALLLEFFLLLAYANVISIQRNPGTKTAGGENTDLGPITDQINSYQESITSTMGGYTEKLGNIEKSLNVHNDQIEKLNTNMEDLVDAQLDEKVKTILSGLIKKDLTQ